jgi:hypothetical protein
VDKKKSKKDKERGKYPRRQDGVPIKLALSIGIDPLPVAPPPPGEKVNNKIRVFPKDKWLQPSLAFPPYDEASSPKVTHRKRARGARSPAPKPFEVPIGEGQVIIADSMPTHCRVYPAGFVVSPDTGVTLAAF